MWCFWCLPAEDAPCARVRQRVHLESAEGIETSDSRKNLIMASTATAIEITNMYDLPGRPDDKVRWEREDKAQRAGKETCVNCGRPVSANSWTILVDGHGKIEPVANWTEFWNSNDCMGGYPVGSECAKAIPLTHRKRTA